MRQKMVMLYNQSAALGASPTRVRLRGVRTALQSLFASDSRKIFCLGLNKTGTTSLHRYFQSLGLVSVHQMDWANYTRLFEQKKSFYAAQCFSDGERPDFTFLDQNFPSSLFILNSRDERDWLRSRVKHLLRLNVEHDASSVLRDTRFGIQAREYFADNRLALINWVSDRRIYHHQVKAYFKGSSQLLEIDVTSEDDWQMTLREFLEENEYVLGATSSATPGPLHENSRSDADLDLQESVEEGFRLIDEILHLLDDPNYLAADD